MNVIFNQNLTIFVMQYTIIFSYGYKKQRLFPKHIKIFGGGWRKYKIFKSTEKEKTYNDSVAEKG